jgi:hypothetical protein
MAWTALHGAAAGVDAAKALQATGSWRRGQAHGHVEGGGAPGLTRAAARAGGHLGGAGRSLAALWSGIHHTHHP